MFSEASHEILPPSSRCSWVVAVMMLWARLWEGLGAMVGELVMDLSGVDLDGGGRYQQRS